MPCFHDSIAPVALHRKRTDAAQVRLKGSAAATNFSLSDYRGELGDYHRKNQEMLEKGINFAGAENDEFEDWIKNGYAASSDPTANQSKPGDRRDCLPVLFNFPSEEPDPPHCSPQKPSPRCIFSFKYNGVWAWHASIMHSKSFRRFTTR